ncbi:MAG: nucleotide exchange factor GrpE [Oscillospiraceae bacterium]|jgi:molecular chaperone GrpE (heat shock protein)|nr:nucleotide exchange factor GrpE [Oscillospiraceae bacterium]
MLDFEKELEKLLAGEGMALETNEFEVLADEGKRLLKDINDKQADISLQVEEIYDIIKEKSTHEDMLRTERARLGRFVNVAVGLSDIVEDFLRFAEQSGNAELEYQARMMWKNAGNLLEACSVGRIGEAGQPLDPNLHSVHAAEASEYPHECISKVLQSGYHYSGRIIRKATVVVSASSR